MMHYPLWKRLLVLAICLVGFVVVLPNLFYGRVEGANDARNAVERGQSLTPEMQAAEGQWPAWLPSKLVNLGLDLRGGAYVLVQVEAEEVYAERLESFWPTLRDKLRDLRDTVGTVRRLEAPGELRVRIGNPAGMDAAIQAVRDASAPVFSLTGASGREFQARADGDFLVVTLSDAEKAATTERTMQQSLEIVRRRVDESGTREPSIQRQGADRILVQVPGVGSAEELLQIIGTTARLSFHAVVSRSSDPNVRPGLDQFVAPAEGEPGVFYVLEKRSVVTGEQLDDSQPSFDQNGRPAVTFRFNPLGGRGLRRLYRGEHRQALRHRPRRQGDLGADDPVPHRRRVGDHHRQLHPRGVRTASPCCSAPAPCPPRSRWSSSGRSGRSSGRTRSTPAASRPRSPSRR